MLISLFKNSSSNVPIAHIEFEEFVERIRNGFWKKGTLNVRGKKDLKAYKKAKTSTPAVTISAQFKTRDRQIPIAQRIIKPTGLIALDVDKKDNPNLNAKYLVDNECLAQYLSIGGEGIKIVYRCKPTIDPAEHRRIYDAAVFRLQRKGIKLKVDPIVKSVASFQFVSWDENIFYRPKTKLVIQPLPKIKTKPREPSADQVKDLQQLNEYIDQLGTKDITANYEDWMNIAFGISYSFGEAGREAFHKISKNYPNYNESECDEKYDAVLERDMESIERPVTVGTVFQLIISKLPKITLRQLAKKHNKGHTIGQGEDSVEQGDLSGMVRYKLFLFKKVFDKEENKLCDLLLAKLNLNEFEKLLKAKGFYRYEDMYVHIVDNIVEKVDADDILRIITKHVEGDGDYDFTYNKLEFHYSWEEISHFWRELRGFSSIYNQIAASLEHWQPNLLKDTVKESYIPYQNGVVLVTGKQFKLLPYKEIKSQIWKERILPRDFQYTDKVGMFEEFFGNVCGRGKDRKAQLKSEEHRRAVWYFGYMLHRIKRKSLARAFILYDIKPGNNGRTGKSIIGEAVGKIRSMETIDGKLTNFSDNRFWLQKANPWTDVIFIDDPKRNMSLNPLFNMITGKSDVEKKNEQMFTVDLKFMIASNWILESEGNSESGRQFVTQVDDFYVQYGKKKGNLLTPIVHYHGKEFFTDWDTKDWNQFDSFAIRCLQYHLSAESPQNTIIGNSALVRFIQLNEREMFYELSMALCNNIKKGKEGGLLIGQRLLINIIKENNSNVGGITAGRIAREFLTAINAGEVELTSFMIGNTPQMAYKINKRFEDLTFGEISSKLPKPKL